MKNYLDILQHVVDNGRIKGNRTGVGTRYIFSEKFKHDMSTGFPLLTTKKINPKQVLGELFGFLTGVDTIQGFQAFGCNIWNAWGLKHETYQLVLRNEEEYTIALAELEGITAEEAAEQIKDVAAKLESWTISYQELLAKISNGEIKTEQNESMESLQIKVSELLVEKPKAVIEWLASKGIDIHVKDIEFPEGYLGPIYGKQWLEWRTTTGDIINQIQRIAYQLEHCPMSRRITLTAWNPEVIPADRYASYPNGKPAPTSEDQIQCAILDGKQALPPCHLMVILDVDVDTEKETSYLNMEVIMRSTDVPVGLPYNIASYAYLMEMISAQFGFVSGTLAIEMVNCHVYEDQLESAAIQLGRTPTELPTLKPVPQDIKFDKPETLTVENMERILNGLENYNPQGFIKYPVAV